MRKLLIICLLLQIGCDKTKFEGETFTLMFVSSNGSYSISPVCGAIGQDPHRREVRVWVPKQKGFGGWTTEEQIVSAPSYLKPPVETYLEDKNGRKLRLCGFESETEETNIPFKDWIKIQEKNYRDGVEK